MTDINATIVGAILTARQKREEAADAATIAADAKRQRRQNINDQLQRLSSPSPASVGHREEIDGITIGMPGGTD